MCNSYLFWGPQTACYIFADLLKNSKAFHANSQFTLAFQIQIMQLNKKLVQRNQQCCMRQAQVQLITFMCEIMSRFQHHLVSTDKSDAVDKYDKPITE